MAIAIDTTGNSGTLAGVSAGTLSFTMGAVTDGILMLLSAVRDTASATDGTITGATYRGTALTKIREDIQTASPLNEFSAIWYILNPSSGTGNLIVTYSGAVNSVTFGAASFSGVDQITPIAGSAGGTGVNPGTATPETQSVAINTTSANEYLVGVTFNTTSNGTRPLTEGADQTRIFLLGPGSNGDSSAASYKGAGAAGAKTFSYTWDGAGNANQGWAMSVAALNPAVAAGATPTPNLRAMLGVGS
jgi:hypothetical protein